MSRPTHQPIALEVPEVAGKRVTVMGLGLHGGGFSTARFLAGLPTPSYPGMEGFAHDLPGERTSAYRDRIGGEHPLVCLGG